MTDLPRGIRNHNPGNIERGDPWQGLAADQSADDRFAVFESPRWGIRAIARVLITYQDRRRARDGSKIDTVREIIERWAPPHENDTSAYARHVRQRLGLGGEEIPGEIDVHDHTVMRPLVEAIILHENGMQPYDDATIDQGLRLAGVEMPQKPLSRSRTLAGQTAAATGTAAVAAQEIGQQATEAAGQISFLVEYGWVFQALFLMLIIGGIGLTVYARLDDRAAGKA